MEEPLSGGNISEGVVRVGDTVRRPTGPWTPAVHALLRHLEAAGYHGSPRVLGIDDQGREILTYMQGQAVTWDNHRELLGTDAALAAAALLLRGYHDAVATFVPPRDAEWRGFYGDLEPETICHHDPGAWNLIVGTDGPVGFIDWDWAGPGTLLWDVAYAAQSMVPLADTPPDGYTEIDVDARLVVFCDAYGLTAAPRAGFVDAVIERTTANYEQLRVRSQAGEEPWKRLWGGGHGEGWRRNAVYCKAHAEHWRDLLTRTGGSP